MAAGWPTKVTYANGDVYSASDVNDTNGTLNYIDPTSATNNQVLTRDSAAAGKVKWANSPANTLTTTGDLYYASAANTPARLGIGSTGQVLSVSGGVPSWANAGGGYTSIASGTLSGASVDLTSISGSYINLVLYLLNPSITTAGNINLTVNNVTTASTYLYQYSRDGSTALTNTSGANIALAPFNGFGTSTTGYSASNITINNYAGTTNYKEIAVNTVRPLIGSYEFIHGYQTTTATSAITSIKLTPTSNFTGGTYVLYGVK
jgi:hypothetical protein